MFPDSFSGFVHRLLVILHILGHVILLTSCWTRIYPAFANSVEPDQLASEENWSESALFAIKFVNLYQSGSSNLIGWKLEVGMAS